MFTRQQINLTADQAWCRLVADVMNLGDESAPRGLRTKEILANQSCFDMRHPIVTIKERNLGYRFLPAEAWWILTGSNRVAEIAPFSSMISKFSDDGITFAGAYGPKVIEQLPYVVKTLRDDESSRQAVLTIWRERPAPSRDIPCTVSAQWFIRRHNDVPYLHCSVYMRSSDVWLGVPYDWFNFSMISLYVLLCLNQPDLRLGHMFWTAGSQHLYEQHWKTCSQIAADQFTRGFDYLPVSMKDWEGKEPFLLVKHLRALADRHGAHAVTNMFEELLKLPGGSSDDLEGCPRGFS